MPKHNVSNETEEQDETITTKTFLKNKYNLIKNILKAEKERDSVYNGFLSTNTERHSFVIGLVVGAYYPAYIKPLIAYALGKGGGKKIYNQDSHIKDIAEEPAYALAGLYIGQEFIAQSIPKDIFLEFINAILNLPF